MPAPAHDAFVENAQELRMGSPTYGRLILDGEGFRGTELCESDSLIWSGDRRLLAAQELDPSISYPGTRVIVIDADSRTVVARSPGLRGLSNPIRFEGETLVYEHWQYGRDARELPLEINPR